MAIRSFWHATPGTSTAPSRTIPRSASSRPRNRRTHLRRVPELEPAFFAALVAQEQKKNYNLLRGDGLATVRLASMHGRAVHPVRSTGKINLRACILRRAIWPLRRCNVDRMLTRYIDLGQGPANTCRTTSTQTTHRPDWDHLLRRRPDADRIEFAAPTQTRRRQDENCSGEAERT